MNDQSQKIKKCRRCRKPLPKGSICQECKNDLLSNYEASNDWQTAYEIERAQLFALRYQIEEKDDDYPYYE